MPVDGTSVSTAPSRKKSVATCRTAVSSFVLGAGIQPEADPNGPSGGDSTQVQRYDFFDGRYEEVGAFGRTASGAEVTMFMHDNNPPDAPPPGIVGPLPCWGEFHSAVYRRQ
jgi:hypothetical protein